MAALYPVSNKMAEILSAMPGPGDTHRWFAQVAGGIKDIPGMTPERAFKYLRHCCDVLGAYRTVPDREIQGAVEFAFSASAAGPKFGRESADWKKPDPVMIQDVLATQVPLFDGLTSTGLRPRDVLPILFRPGELVCTGPDAATGTVRPLEEVLDLAAEEQFICVNPMRARLGRNQSGHPSTRCHSNTGERRHVVTEFDDRALSKPQQAQLVSWLAKFAPLVMAVDSGGKSVHGWFYVERLSRQDQMRFFGVACLLGADRSRWDICGWLRMPGGTRLKPGPDGTLCHKVRQRILYMNAGAMSAEREGKYAGKEVESTGSTVDGVHAAAACGGDRGIGGEDTGAASCSSPR